MSRRTDVIGVLVDPHQRVAVEEFFQLFKTPWEFYEPEHEYDVVVTACREVPLPRNTRLLVVYGTDSTADAILGLEASGRHTGVVLDERTGVPLYGDACTFVRRPADGPCVTSAAGVAVLQLAWEGRQVVRAGYNLFEEVRILLTSGQGVDHAGTPTLDLHIGMLRSWIVGAGLPLLEIPPIPGGYRFAACLTHDIDFVGIRRHVFDHSMWGFLFRATVGAAGDLLRRRISPRRAARMWGAALSLPAVYLGWMRDFWEPFAWYLQVERGIPATYYVLPFKNRPGRRVLQRNGKRRAASYEVSDIGESIQALRDHGCEIAVHGIDAWHDPGAGRAELVRVADVSGDAVSGVRIHWLLFEPRSYGVLEEAGYAYDSTSGFNETIGYRSGTAQVFRPFGVSRLLELPMHIQDGALFLRQRLDLPEPEARARCRELLQNAERFGGVLTVLWHDRSHGPERFWGNFYIQLIRDIRAGGAWFGTARGVVEWFRCRRLVQFGRSASHPTSTTVSYQGAAPVVPPFVVRRYRPYGSDAKPDQLDHEDLLWDGSREFSVSASFQDERGSAAVACSH